MSMAPVSQALGECPSCCAVNEETGQGQPCGMSGTKLSRASEGRCLTTCVGPSCRNRRNQKKGKRTEYNRHRRFGKGGWTPHDELPEVYSLEFTTQDKAGRIVPATFLTFAQSEWARHAFEQATRKIPEGVACHAALYLEPPGPDWFLLVRGPKGAGHGNKG